MRGEAKALALLVALCVARCSEDIGRRDASQDVARSEVMVEDASSENALRDTAEPRDVSADRVIEDVSLDTEVDATHDAAMDFGIDVPVDASLRDTGVSDTSIRDTGADAGVDTGVDTGVDSGVPTGGCLSGSTGAHVARFRWTGTAPMSRATVSYEANTLPDRSRWRVTAANRGPIGSYTPTFTDTFLGEGGLQFDGTTFMDVELSTQGLSAITNVSLAIYGRSFNTTTSGSFSWMSFDGAGTAPSGLVSNVAPYRWYRADASSAFRPGNGSVLLRIMPGPPSGALIVSRVELCFNAR
jgi:hypothetical protein